MISKRNFIPLLFLFPQYVGAQSFFATFDDSVEAKGQAAICTYPGRYELLLNASLTRWFSLSLPLSRLVPGDYATPADTINTMYIVPADNGMVRVYAGGDARLTLTELDHQTVAGRLVYYPASLAGGPERGRSVVALFQARFLGGWPTPGFACSVAGKRDYIAAQHWDPIRSAAILRGEVQVGMSNNMVIQSWGHPLRAERTGTSDGVEELWTYPGGSFVRLRNGFVIVWKEIRS